MKSVLIAIDPTSQKGTNFFKFCDLVRLFQDREIFFHSQIGSIIHPGLYTVPNSWYREMKGEYAKEAAESIEKDCSMKFAFDSVKVLTSETHVTESLIAKISSFSIRKGIDLLVIPGSEKSGLPYWMLGSFSETAALTAQIPVLVIKPHLMLRELSKEVRFLVATDVSAPPSRRELNWIAKTTVAAKASLDLLYVRPRGSKTKDEQAVLKNLQLFLKDKGCSVHLTVLDEGQSAAHTIVDFADSRMSWITITTAAKRSVLRKMLLGSTARRVLALSKRPILSLRLT